MSKVYLSGPMTGRPDYNREAFMAAEASLRKLGFEVVNPHRVPEPPGLRPNDAEHNWRRYLARDLALLLTEDVDLVALLPGWRESRGSVLEAKAAEAAGIETLPADILIRAEEILRRTHNG